MRTLHTDKIIEAVKEMCISANLYLADDMDGKIRQAAKEEDSTLGKQILNQLIENMEIAGRSDTNLSGYRNGSVLRECWTESAH